MTQPPDRGEPEPAAATAPAGRAATLDPARVAGAFGLGASRGPLAPVAGAWSNRLWRLETERGAFAVKELRGSAAAGWRRRLRDAMAVERATWAAGTVPMAQPMTAAAGGWLAEVATTGGGRATVRCHRWVPGTPAAALAPGPALAADVGRSLAAIHALDLPTPATTTHEVAPLPLHAWNRLVAEARQAGLAWAGELAGLTPLVGRLAGRLEALRRAGRTMLRSHRDLDPKNAVVRPDARVALLDWDYAGPILPAAELLVTALSFAGAAGGERDTACVRACVRGYLEAGGRPQAPTCWTPPSSTGKASTGCGATSTAASAAGSTTPATSCWPGAWHPGSSAPSPPRSPPSTAGPAGCSASAAAGARSRGRWPPPAAAARTGCPRTWPGTRR
jgi:Ser/Thr protein kinase RdoA (MazF antagonist)